MALLTDFTPTAVLYQLYLDHVRGRESNELVTLNEAQFGTVLTRLFPYLDEDRWKHVRRKVNGVLQRGWIGLVGPASVRVQSSPGRKAGYKKPAPTPLYFDDGCGETSEGI